MRKRKKNDDYPIKGKRKKARRMYIKKEQKMSSVRISLGKVVEEDSWKAMLRYLSKQMKQMRWVGTRAFNHFVIFAVLNGEFDITDDKVLSSTSSVISNHLIK